MYKLLIGWMLICLPIDANALSVAATRPARIAVTGNPKAWIQDPAGFLSTRIDTRWIIGRSTRPCVTDGYQARMDPSPHAHWTSGRTTY